MEKKKQEEGKRRHRQDLEGWSEQVPLSPGYKGSRQVFTDGGEEGCSGGKLDWNVGVGCGSENVITCHRTSSVAYFIYTSSDPIACCAFFRLPYPHTPQLQAGPHTWAIHGHMRYLSPDLSEAIRWGK